MLQWKLKRPDVIISVTGGASDFDLSTEESERIFKAMMDGTRSLDAWFVTGGTHAGVMKYVGKYRAKYNPTAPLIGVTPIGIVSGLERLRGLQFAESNQKLDQEKKGWQRLGYEHECLPAISAGFDEARRQETDGLQVRIENLQARIDDIDRLIQRYKRSAELAAPSSKVVLPGRMHVCLAIFGMIAENHVAATCTEVLTNIRYYLTVAPIWQETFDLTDTSKTAKSHELKLLENAKEFVKKIKSETEGIQNMQQQARNQYEEFRVELCSKGPISDTKVTKDGAQASLDQIQDLEESSSKVRKNLKLPGVRLDPNHSHFIFAGWHSQTVKIEVH